MSLTATIEARHGPIAWVRGSLADLGGITILAAKAVCSPLGGRGDSPPILRAAVQHAGWMLSMGVPLVGLVHVSFGSFLAMQAYFGATFTEATGIVVGLGLIRNVAPLLSGFVLAGLIATKVTSDLRGGPRPGMDDPGSLPDRDVSQGTQPDRRAIPGPPRIALARFLGAVLAGPTLAVWGVFVGCLMGLLVARSMLGQSPAIFLGKMAEMLQPVDVLGLLVKGIVFAGAATFISTYEGLRPELEGGPDGYRAALRSIVAVLLLNFTWFNLVYLAGDPFGPDVAATTS